MLPAKKNNIRRSVPFTFKKHCSCSTCSTKSLVDISYPAPETKETAAIDWSKYEAKTPEEAFKLTHSTLKKVSVNLNKGAKNSR